jgi:hypothetical protein
VQRVAWGIGGTGRAEIGLARSLHREENMNTDQIVADLAHVAYLVSSYGGRMSEFTPDALGLMWDPLDSTAHQEARARMGNIALVVATDSGAEAVAGWMLAWACRGDAWALKEVAGRFHSACARVRLAVKIGRRRDAGRWESLVRAVMRGKASPKQMDLARKLAGEAR